MTDTYAHPAEPTTEGLGFLRKTEMWLDERGKGAWIAAMVFGFVFFWPVGLALLAYMIWSKRMFAGKCAARRKHGHTFGRQDYRSSGNTAFDAYKADTLRRLEQEQNDFEAFLERLREAKDKSEFDQFMDDRARVAGQSDTDATDAR